MPKVRKQKAHLNRARQQRAVNRKKTHRQEKESHNPVVTEQPEDLPSTSEICSQVQESSASGLGSQTQESGSCSESESSFDPDEALLKDPDAMIEEFAADWVASLPRDDLYALSLLLFHILQQEFQQLIYPASENIGRVLNKNYVQDHSKVASGFYTQ